MDQEIPQELVRELDLKKYSGILKKIITLLSSPERLQRDKIMNIEKTRLPSIWSSPAYRRFFFDPIYPLLLSR